jgi:outer membrane protein assembly factor BamE
MKQNLLSQCGLFIIIFMLVSCAVIPLHKPDIEQGNIITQDMLVELNKGMNKRQVINLLGTPVLENGFTDANRWYYVYTFQPGKTGILQRKYLVIYFRNNVVIDIVNAYPMKPFHGMESLSTG